MVPSVFFSRLLPQVRRPEELVVSLYLLYLHGRRRGWPRLFTLGELAAHRGLMQALANLGEAPPEGALAVGLSWAEAHGVAVRVPVREGERAAEAYMLSFPANRRAFDALAGREPRLEAPPPAAEPAETPNVFALYEENIGAITPLIADDLQDAEARYPPQWIAAAFKEAVSLNKRSWRYVHSILRRWEAEGPDYEEAGRDPSTSSGQVPETDWLERRYARGKGRRPSRR
jgi:DnaD/phage-associated family protein